MVPFLLHVRLPDMWLETLPSRVLSQLGSPVYTFSLAFGHSGFYYTNHINTLLHIVQISHNSSYQTSYCFLTALFTMPQGMVRPIDNDLQCHKGKVSFSQRKSVLFATNVEEICIYSYLRSEKFFEPMNGGSLFFSSCSYQAM